MWHQPKVSTKAQSQLISEINNSLSILEQVNLFQDPQAVKNFVNKSVEGVDVEDMEMLH